MPTLNAKMNELIAIKTARPGNEHLTIQGWCVEVLTRANGLTGSADPIDFETISDVSIIETTWDIFNAIEQLKG